jgi:hypothetical protein
MLVQFALTFGLLEMSVDTGIFAVAAIELHESPDCTVATVLQSSPTSPKQRSCVGLPLAENTKEGVFKLYLSFGEVVTEGVDGSVDKGELVATVRGWSAKRYSLWFHRKHLRGHAVTRADNIAGVA